MVLSARLLAAGDEAAIDDFLRPNTPFAYFIRSNLRRGGIVFENAIYQADYIAAFDDNVMTGVLAHSWSGNVQVFTPNPDDLSQILEVWKPHFARFPRPISGFLGPSDFVEILLALLKVSASLLRGGLRSRETLLVLALEKLKIPTQKNDVDFKVRLADWNHAEMLISWRRDYFVEALSFDAGEDTFVRARDEIMRRIGEGDLFVLETDNEIVSFCGAGGYLPDWKIVGPVWTPCEKRRRGYGALVTAGALLYLRHHGASQAVLFTSNSTAEKIYRSLGFEVIGDWSLDLLKTPLLRL